MERFAGRYALLRRLGRGGMGAVHLALDLSTGSECALKRLDPGLVRVGPDSLRREFELLARVRHPAVVAVHELGFAPDGTPFYTMEYVPGAPAHQVLRPGDWRALCFVAARVAHGLEALHANHVVHGDLKPSNLLVIPGPAPDALPAGVRLVDFGLAALLGRDRESHRGTAGYAAPEVLRGDPLCVGTDLYGLGATLYTLAAGKPPFGRRSSPILAGVPQSAAPSSVALEEARVPPALIQLILRLMAPAPGDRPGDAREVRLELERIHPAARWPLAERLRTETLVGRERELARIERWMALAPAGPRMLIVSGEAGEGKTALLRELATRASLGGRPAFLLSGGVSGRPCALAITMLERLAAEAGASEDGTDLSRRCLQRLESDARSFGAEDLSLLVEGAAAWARALQHGGGAPVFLLDDDERIDAASRDLIRRLALEPRTDALRWVRAVEGGAAALAEEDRVLIDAGLAEHLPLGALEREAATRLVAARLNESPPAALIDFLWERSGGHPGLLIELLRAAAEGGALREDDAGLALDTQALERIAFPAGFEASLLGRLASLPEAARRTAAALAVWGRPASAAELAISPSSDERAREELERAGLAAKGSDGTWSLRPPGLGARVLESLDPGERCALHSAVLLRGGLSDAERFAHLRGAGRASEALAAAAQALEANADERLATAASDLAEREAPAEVATWLERAARVLQEHGRYAQAIPHLERALERAREPRARARLWQLLSAAHLRAGLPAGLAQVVERGLAESPPAATKALLLCNASAGLASSGDLEKGLKTAEEAVRLGRSSGDDEAAGMSALTLGALHLALGHMAEAAALGREAEEACMRARHQLGRVRAIGLRAAAALHEQGAGEAERLYGEALAAARAHGLRMAAEELTNNLAVLLLEAGRWREARAAHASALQLAMEDGRSHSVALGLALVACDDGLMGRPARALRHARRAVRMARMYRPWSEPFALRTLALARRASGRLRSAEKIVRRALDLATRFGIESEADWCRIEYAQVCAAAGRWKEVGEVCDTVLARRTPGNLVAAVMMNSLSGRAAIRRGDSGVAAARRRAAAECLEARRAPYAEACALQLEAESALAHGDLGQGLELASRTLAVFDGLPAPADRSAAALEFARLALSEGGEPMPTIGEWLQESAASCERRGDRRGRERALTLEIEWLRRSQASISGSSNNGSLLRSVSRLLDSFADLHELTQRAMQLAVEQFGAERGVLLLADPQTHELVSVVEHGAVDGATRDAALSYSRRAVERVARSGGSLLIGDAPSDPEALSDSVVDLGLRSIVCVPLYAAGKVIGAVYLDDSRRAEVFSEADRGLLEGFAHLVAVAIEKSRGHEEIQRANELLVGENLSLRREAGAKFQPRNFIGPSAAMQQVLAVVERAAETSTTVLITGESGTGKELIARILHHSGKRRLGPFVAINCGAMPESLLESELFGILPNVATGVRGREGRFVQANGGTLFLDEVGSMPLAQQVALLSVIANREVTPVGGGRPTTIDVRIVAATNSDLAKAVQDGAFREDLYYRLNVIPIELPPLRERKADIPALADYFAEQFAKQQERDKPQLSPDFLAALMQSDWSGNVRELQNYIERVMAMTTGHVLYPRPLPRDLERKSAQRQPSRVRRLIEHLATEERRILRETLERCGGNQSRAARELGLTEQSLRYRLRKFAEERPRRSARTRRKRR
ncbi:MAG TPA: sigma 54-interacting transcriptional regulator [Terriglobales bacterium]|nr:sigma 54-interacting transcriptional regulator [Terriglobales bacterium]